MKNLTFILAFLGILGCSTVSKMMGKKNKKRSPPNTSAQMPSKDPTETGIDPKTGKVIVVPSVEGEVLIEGQANLANTNVIWRRYRALESRYLKAFELSKDELCNEVGRISCVDKMHLYNLGGNDPIDAGQMTRPSDPTFLSSVALDRLAMTACSNRILKDKAVALSEAKTFKFFTLDTNPVPSDQIRDFSVHLYRSILARDPSEEELIAIEKFAKDSESSEVFAHQACYAVATMLENIFI